MILIVNPGLRNVNFAGSLVIWSRDVGRNWADVVYAEATTKLKLATNIQKTIKPRSRNGSEIGYE